jgi:hypothetical protein
MASAGQWRGASILFPLTPTAVSGFVQVGSYFFPGVTNTTS